MKMEPQHIKTNKMQQKQSNMEVYYNKVTKDKNLK